MVPPIFDCLTLTEAGKFSVSIADIYRTDFFSDSVRRFKKNKL